MHSSSRRSNQVVSARAVALGAIAALLLASPLGADEPDTAPPRDVAPSTMTLERLVTAIRHAQGALAPERTSGFRLDPWMPIGEESWKTLNTNRTVFTKAVVNTTDTEVGA